MDDFQTPTRAVAMRTRLVVLEEKWPIVEDRIDAKLVGLDEGSTFRRCRRQQTIVNTPCKTCRRIAVRLFPLNFGLDLRREHFRNIYHRQSRIAGYGCCSLFHFGRCKRPFLHKRSSPAKTPTHVVRDHHNALLWMRYPHAIGGFAKDAREPETFPRTLE